MASLPKDFYPKEEHAASFGEYAAMPDFDETMFVEVSVQGDDRVKILEDTQGKDHVHDLIRSLKNKRILSGVHKGYGIGNIEDVWYDAKEKDIRALLQIDPMSTSPEMAPLIHEKRKSIQQGNLTTVSLGGTNHIYADGKEILKPREISFVPRPHDKKARVHKVWSRLSEKECKSDNADEVLIKPTTLASRLKRSDMSAPPASTSTPSPQQQQQAPAASTPMDATPTAAPPVAAAAGAAAAAPPAAAGGAPVLAWKVPTKPDIKNITIASLYTPEEMAKLDPKTKILAEREEQRSRKDAFDEQMAAYNYAMSHGPIREKLMPFIKEPEAADAFSEILADPMFASAAEVLKSLFNEVEKAKMTAAEREASEKTAQQKHESLNQELSMLVAQTAYGRAIQPNTLKEIMARNAAAASSSSQGTAPQGAAPQQQQQQIAATNQNSRGLQYTTQPFQSMAPQMISPNTTLVPVNMQAGQGQPQMQQIAPVQTQLTTMNEKPAPTPEQTLADQKRAYYQNLFSRSSGKLNTALLQ